MLRSCVLVLTVLILSLGVPALADGGETPVRYDEHKLVRVGVQSWSQIEQIRALGGLLMSEAEGIGPVDYLLPPEAMSGLAALGVQYVVLNDNIQRDIDAERERLAQQLAPDPNDPNWFKDYKNYDQVNAKLNKMAADRPDLASVFDIGVSQQNRHIYGIRISGPGTNKPAVQFNGCHHAREWVTVMVPMWIADRLVYEYDSDPNIHSLVNRVEFFIIPIVNVDGYVYSWTTNRLWRKNRREPPPQNPTCWGVDDNRNYDANFGGGGSSGNPCDETYRGPYAFSEPETAAMRDFTIAHPQIVATQSYHSYSQLFMSPYGYTSALPADHAIFIAVDATSAALIESVHGMHYDYGPIYSTIYQVSGGDVDWYYDSRGIFAFTTELRDTGQYGFELPPAQIIPTCQENFAAAFYLADWASTPVKFDFPGGLPSRLDPNTPTTVKVKISVVGATFDPNSPRLWTRVGSAGSFSQYTLTALGGGLYDATLPATPCGKTLYYYFSAATTAGFVGYSPTDAPNATYSAPALPILVVLDKDMSSNPGWTFSGGTWGYGKPTGGGGQYGCKDPTSGYTGNNVVGYNLSGDYTNNMPEYHATTPAINCTGLTGVRLSFYRWLGVESGQYDHAYVRVSTNGSTWSNVWQNTAEVADGKWVYQEYDLSSWANNKPTVYLRWTMGTTDAYARYCGWNIDDVKVWAPDPNGCPNEPGDMNCDGQINFDDINPFVLALSDPGGYAAAYPNCDIMNGDCNDDGLVDFNDINPFVALLTGL